ncbi:MAG: hypothetical protein ACRCWM_13295 [Sarcina sp.]
MVKKYKFNKTNAKGQATLKTLWLGEQTLTFEANDFVTSSHTFKVTANQITNETFYITPTK